MSAAYKALIKNTYTKLIDPSRYELTPTEIQKLLGEEAANSKDDYYNNKYAESFMETRRYADRNAKILEAEAKKKAAASTESENSADESSNL
jgi:hypothetical protein